MRKTPSGAAVTDPVITPLDHSDRLPRLGAVLDEILPGNAFQRQRLGPRRQVDCEADFLSLPLLSKQQLVDDAAAHPPFGSNLTYPLASYTRFHQTSGTTGTPLRILDDEASWDWWGRCWLRVFEAAGVTAADRLFFAFSFAPSIGFWSSCKAAEMLGAMVIPSGGHSTAGRLRMMLDTEATVLLCTPSYALRLAEVAAEQRIVIKDSPVGTLIHAGEPGASIPATRRRLEEAWGATAIDHAGATEIGAWGYGTSDGRGLYVNEDEFIAEVIDRHTLEPIGHRQQGELVITALGRTAWPVIRYRTGDIVSAVRENGRLLLEGGVLGRADDMVVIRGVNIFPSAIENIIRLVAAAAEFRVTARRQREMDELAVDLEADGPLCQKVSAALRERLGLRIDVQPVASDSLPRWEAKHGRFVDLRSPE